MNSRFIIFAIYALVAVSLWNPGGTDLNSSGVWALARYALFLLFSGAIILHTVLDRGLVISRSPEWILLAAFLLYTALSAFWSQGGIDAAIKGALIASACLVSICMANAVGLARILRIFYDTMAAFVLLSLVVVIFFPEYGIETGWLLEGDWRGIAGQKNGLGMVASMVLVASLTLPLARHADAQPTGLSWLARLTVVGVSALCLVNSGSRGAVLVAVIGLAFILAARLPHAVQRVGLIVALMLALPVVILAFGTLEFNADKIDVLGTTIDTNNRVTLWLYGLTQLDGRELLGFGVGGFWTPARVTTFEDVHGWVLDNFHNGYITIIVEGGIVGIGLLSFALIFLVLLYLVVIGNVRDSYVALAFGYLGMYLIGNVTENEIGRSTSLTLILFLATSFALRAHVVGILGAGLRRSRHIDRDDLEIGSGSPAPTLS